MKHFNEGETVQVLDQEEWKKATVFVHKYNNVALEFDDTGERDIVNENKVQKSSVDTGYY